MSKGILRSNLLYCDHLGVSTLDRLDVASFSVDRPEGLGLVEYLQHSAFSDETQGTMRSYVVRDLRTSEVVGYFSLKAV